MLNPELEENIKLGCDTNEALIHSLKVKYDEFKDNMDEMVTAGILPGSNILLDSGVFYPKDRIFDSDDPLNRQIIEKDSGQ